MNCSYCQIAFDPYHWDACPHCGAEHDFSPMEELSGVMRTSTILIAAGNHGPEIYRSVEEVPEPLRRMLTASTNGLNSGTIYIADEGGRERIGRALRIGAPHRSKAPALARISANVQQPSGRLQPETQAKRPVPLSSLWFGLAIAAFTGAVVWLAGSRSW